MFDFLRKKPAPEVDPMDRLRAAVDEANLAMKLVRKGGNKLRFWNKSTPGRANELVIGYWDSYNTSFVEVYPEN